jgi:hypothetical protein
VVAWLEPLSHYLVVEFENLVEAGVISRVRLHPCGRPYYLRSEIEAHLLRAFREAEGKVSSHQ